MNANCLEQIRCFYCIRFLNILNLSSGQMMLLIRIIGCVHPVIGSIVFEPNLPFVEIWQWRDRTKGVCELIKKRIIGAMKLFIDRLLWQPLNQFFSVYFPVDMEMKIFHATTYGATLYCFLPAFETEDPQFLSRSGKNNSPLDSWLLFRL